MMFPLNHGVMAANSNSPSMDYFFAYCVAASEGVAVYDSSWAQITIQNPGSTGVLAFSRDSQQLACARTGLDVLGTGAWEMVSGTPSFTGTTTDLSYSSSDQFLAVANPGTSVGLRVFDTDSWLQVHSRSGVDRCCYLNNGQWLAVADPDGLTVLQTSDWSELPGFPTITESPVIDLASSSNGGYLAYSVNNAGIGTVLRTSDWEPVLDLSSALSGTGAAMSFNGSGNLFAAGDTNGKVVIFDTDTWTESPVQPAQDPARGTINAVSFSPDGKYLAIGHSGGNYITVFDLTDGSISSVTPSQPSFQVLDVAFSNGGAA